MKIVSSPKKVEDSPRPHPSFPEGRGSYRTPHCSRSPRSDYRFSTVTFRSPVRRERVPGTFSSSVPRLRFPHLSISFPPRSTSCRREPPVLRRGESNLSLLLEILVPSPSLYLETWSRRVASLNPNDPPRTWRRRFGGVKREDYRLPLKSLFVGS